MAAAITSLPTSLRHRLANGPLYYGWFVVAACFLMSVMTWGTIWSFGVFFGYILDDFGLSHANTSVIFSLQSFITTGGGALLGFVIDRYGAPTLMVLAAGVVVVGLFGVSQLGSFTGLLVSYGLVVGAGFGIAGVIEKASPSRWFDRRRGIATGIAGAGAGVGIFLFPPVVEGLIVELGWRGAYGSLMVAFLVAYLLAALFISDRPSDLGLEPSTEFPTGMPHQTSPVDDWRTQVGEVVRIARQPAFGLVFLGALFVGITLFVMLVSIVEFTTSIGLGRGIGVLAISAMGAMNIGGKVVGGAVADRLGRPLTYASCGLFMGGGVGTLVGVSTVAGVLVAAVIFGFGWGIMAGLMAPTIADLFGTISINALIGIIWSGLAISGFLGPYLAGLTFDTFGTYRPAFIGAAGISILGGTLILIAERLASRNPTAPSA